MEETWLAYEETIKDTNEECGVGRRIAELVADTKLAVTEMICGRPVAAVAAAAQDGLMEQGVSVLDT